MEDKEAKTNITPEHQAALNAIMECPNCMSIVGEVWRICSDHVRFTEIPHFGELL